MEETKQAPEPQRESKDIVDVALEAIEAKHKEGGIADLEYKTPEPTDAPAPVKPQGPTMAEVLNTEKKEESPRVIPEAPFLEIKNQNKELKKELKELKTLIESGAKQPEVNSSLLEIAEEHNVDIEFLKKLSATIKDQAKQEAEREYEAKMRPLEEKERFTKKEAIFNYHFERTLDEMPEYKGIVNKDVIQSLASLPQNANKTFPQILEESYGHLVKGKKSIDSGSQTRQYTEEITDVDFDRANNDTEYFKKVMSNPKTKKLYNSQMVKNLKL
jgi:hypothetical protein